MKDKVTQKKKLFIITQNYPYGSGEKTFIEPELFHLIDSGKFDITIISNAPETSKQTTVLPQDVMLKWTKSKSVFQTPIKTIKYILKYFISTETLEEKKEIWNNKAIIGKLAESVFFYVRAQLFWECLQDEKIVLSDAIVYTYWNNIETLALALHKSKYEKVKLISRIHGFDLYDERTKYGRQPFRKVVDTNLDKLFFIAQTGREYYTSKIGCSSRYVLSRLGTNNKNQFYELEKSQQKQDSFLLVSCSNLIPLKRVHLIIDALSEINDFNIEWIHFGDGRLREELEKKAEIMLQNKNNISYLFKGQTDNAEICDFYKNHKVDCFITTSQTEGCPVTIQEAMSYGIPIIATAVGEIPLMINGNGVLLESNPSENEVVDAIVKIQSLSIEEEANIRYKSRKIWEKYFDKDKNYEMFLETLLQM